MALMMLSTSRTNGRCLAAVILGMGRRWTANFFHCMSPIPVVSAVFFIIQVIVELFKMAQRYFKGPPVMMKPLSLQYNSESE